MISKKALKILIDGSPAEIPAGIMVLEPSQVTWMRGSQDMEIILCGLKNRRVAREVKRSACRWYPEKHRILIKSGSSSMVWVSLEHLDRLQGYGTNTSAYFPPSSHRTLGELEVLMETLRSKNGCPWDRKQNHRSLRPYLIEEAYEVIEAIEKQDYTLLKEELGDLLLQVIFHAQLAAEKDRFYISDVIEGVVTKIIRRHPHVFGQNSASSVKEVLKTWEEIKNDEEKEEDKINGSPRQQLLREKDTHLPALIKALKTQQRAAKLGFDWEDDQGPVDKLREELKEFVDAYYGGAGDTIEEELGDFLFSVVNFSRHIGANPEICLSRAVDKFNCRFAYVEEKVYESGKDFSCYNLEELDQWWEEAKKIVEKSNK